MDVKHLPLQHRKTLCGRLRVYEAMAPFQRELNATDGAQRFAKLRGDLATFVTDESARSPDGSHLDEFLRELAGLMQPTVDASARSIPPPHFSNIQQALQQQMQGVSCEQCAGSESVCTGCGRVDNPIVDRGGACLSPFKEQFQFLHDKVLDTYRQHSTAPGCLNQVDVRLTTDLLERTAPFRYCNHASSVVHYHDTVADRQSEVLLYLNPAMLDPASYLAIPYLLAHELICHAWQGVDARSADSRNQISSTGPDDSFAEGWMDAVAWYLLEKWAKQSARVPIRDEHLQIGHEVHRERRLVPLVFNSNEMTPAAWNARTRTCEMTRLGAQTALDFAQLLRDHEDGYEADEVWLKLSLNLNLRAGIVDARQGLVSALSSSLVGNNRQTVSRILDAVHNYCRTNDLWLFLKHFLGKTWRGVP